MVHHESCANDERFFSEITSRVINFHEDNCLVINAKEQNVSGKEVNLESNFGENYFTILYSLNERQENVSRILLSKNSFLF